MTEDRISAKVQMGILKPAGEIFEAMVEPEIMNKYFISTSTGRMESGKSLIWMWEDFEGEHEVKVGKIEKDKVVSFEWSGSGANCVVVITLEAKSENQTLVKVTESEWPADYKGANQCMGQVEGWTHFLCCLKAYLEYGINLRVGGVIK
ncbi:MAG: SRPBCC domain-containing protein [Ignavibacteriaceae bacterium]|nr:SRPBCC domain-containing protein [Ignavibacteriaceae bacterium]